MAIISIILFLIISIINMIELIYIRDFYNKSTTFFYFVSNFITFMLIYYLYSNKFSFIIGLIFPVIILNMVLILLFIKGKLNGIKK